MDDAGRSRLLGVRGAPAQDTLHDQRGDQHGLAECSGVNDGHGPRAPVVGLASREPVLEDSRNNREQGEATFRISLERLRRHAPRIHALFFRAAVFAKRHSER
jgi:hypothetical protein